MSFIDDHPGMLWQHRDAFKGIYCQHRMVGHDDVSLLGDQAPLGGEALLAKTALGLTYALAATHRQTAPNPRVNFIRVLVSVTGARLLRPSPNGHHLLPERTLRRTK